jgi:hypothetical protein
MNEVDSDSDFGPPNTPRAACRWLRNEAAERHRYAPSQVMLISHFFQYHPNTSDVVLNWQRGVAASHDVVAGTASGIWTIIGVSAHEIETDDTGSFFLVSATITVSP